jgi:hypothetical protein
MNEEQTTMGEPEESSKVMGVARKIGHVGGEAVKKATPVVVKSAKKGGELALAGGRKGAQLAVAGATKAKDLVMRFWKQATEPEPSLDDE